MEEGGVNITSLQKQLQKAILILKQCNDVIREVNKTSGPCIQSVKNLTEQYQCCAVVKPSLLGNINLQEVKEKVLFKISTEINNEILKLLSLVSTAWDSCEKMDKQYERCMMVCRQCRSVEEIDYLVKKNPLYPALSDMLSLIEGIGQKMRECCLCKKYLLDSYSPDNAGFCETIEKNWVAGDKELSIKVDECLALTTYFMDLKIT